MLNYAKFVVYWEVMNIYIDIGQGGLYIHDLSMRRSLDGTENANKTKGL